MDHRKELERWIGGDESASQMLARVFMARPFLLPPPFHRVPLRVGNVVELIGPSPSAKTQILIQVPVSMFYSCSFLITTLELALYEL